MASRICEKSLSYISAISNNCSDLSCTTCSNTGYTSWRIIFSLKVFTAIFDESSFGCKKYFISPFFRNSPEIRRPIRFIGAIRHSCKTLKCSKSFFSGFWSKIKSTCAAQSSRANIWSRTPRSRSFCKKKAAGADLEAFLSLVKTSQISYIRGTIRSFNSTKSMSKPSIKVFVPCTTVFRCCVHFSAIPLTKLKMTCAPVSLNSLSSVFRVPSTNCFSRRIMDETLLTKKRHFFLHRLDSGTSSSPALRMIRNLLLTSAVSVIL